MKRGVTGRYETSTSGGETVRAFVPAPLPPDPMLDLYGERQRLLERALLACGRLDGVRALLPDPNLFLYAYVRREDRRLPDNRPSGDHIGQTPVDGGRDGRSFRPHYGGSGTTAAQGHANRFALGSGP